jgi:hypothetical protein
MKIDGIDVSLTSDGGWVALTVPVLPEHREKVASEVLESGQVRVVIRGDAAVDALQAAAREAAILLLDKDA